jgi:hypothetical protein
MRNLYSTQRLTAKYDYYLKCFIHHHVKITIIFYYLCYVVNMKVGAGTTAIHQACDRAQTFKATKKGEGSIEVLWTTLHTTARGRVHSFL